MTLDEFTRKRIETADDAMEVTPSQMLRFVADEIDAGRQNCDGLVVLTTFRPEDGAWEYDTFRANLSRDQELVALVLAHESCIRRWRDAGGE